MDDLIQLLVFAITFIVFIASAIMKQKKKPEAKNSNFESVVESLFGIPTEPIRVQKETPYVEYDWNDNPKNTFDLHDEFIDPKQKAYNDKLAQLVKEEGVKAIKVPDEEKFVDVHADEEVEAEVFHFDLRQAVIYSEIMNRKYF